MTDEQIRAAARAAVADFPPLDEATLNRLAVILAPLGEPGNKQPIRRIAAPAEAAAA